MTILHRVSGGDDPRADVVFIHGLGGHYRRTWLDSFTGSYWPELLGSDAPELAIWTVEHDAGWSFWFGSPMGLMDSGVSLADRLRISLIGRRPTLFVVHSLGGLLIKQVLRRCREAADPDLRRIAESTVGVALLATPHSGAMLASVGSGLPQWLMLAGASGAAATLYLLSVSSGSAVEMPTVLFFFFVLFSAGLATLLLRLAPAVTELRRNESRLRELNEWWFDGGPRYPGRFLYETGRWWGLFKIVDETSAAPIAGLPLPKDHFRICKVAGRQEHAYQTVGLFLFEQLGLNTAIFRTTEHEGVLPEIRARPLSERTLSGASWIFDRIRTHAVALLLGIAAVTMLLSVVSEQHNAEFEGAVRSLEQEAAELQEKIEEIVGENN